MPCNDLHHTYEELIMILSRIAFAAVVLALAFCVGSAGAGTITYTETAVGSGSLGGVNFTDAAITLVAVADTANVTGSSGDYSVNNTSMTVDVAGVGSGTFTIPTVSYFYSGYGSYFDDNGEDNILGVNPPGLSYDLQTSLATVSGTTSINYYVTFATSAGTFHLTSTESNGTYQATLAAVPEPSSLVLAGTAALAGLGLWTRRRRV
jgi:PEP-CTERM motif